MNPVSMHSPNNPDRRAFLKNASAAVGTVALGGVANQGHLHGGDHFIAQVVEREIALGVAFAWGGILP